MRLIERWSKDPTDAVAPRLVRRYVDSRTFASAAEFAEWYALRRDTLFFSDVGGYHWLESSQRAPAGGTEAGAPARRDD